MSTLSHSAAEALSCPAEDLTPGPDDDREDRELQVLQGGRKDSSGAGGPPGPPAAMEMVFFCQECGKETLHLRVTDAMRLIGRVSRSTIYFWMKRKWIHWRLLPNGHRIICRESLSRPVADGSTGDEGAVPPRLFG